MAAGEVIESAVRRLVCRTVCAVLVLLPVAVTAQSRPDFTGVWVLDAGRKDARDVYGELRVIQQTGEAVRLTMVDFGSAWIQGSFRGVVRFVPWTFPLGWWAPRRGPEDAQQPLARGRLAGGRLVLAKASAQGNADFVWVWSLAGDGSQFVHQETEQSWDSDFDARPPEGGRTYFLHASVRDTVSAASLNEGL